LFLNKQEIIVIRGGGDLATGVIQKFYRSGYKLLVLEADKPTAIRRSVALCEAVYTGFVQVEDVPCTKIHKLEQLEACWQQDVVPLIVDPTGDSVEKVGPHAVIDAILAKCNLGTHRGTAPITIGLGPGFCAGEDVDAVIETMRGHDLGRLILKGSAMPNTGIPGEIGGKSVQRVLHAPVEGTVKHIRQIGDVVNQGEDLFIIGEQSVRAPFKGLIHGLIREGLTVTKGMKVADIDPRTDLDWRTISDKARCIGGAALEAYMYLSRIKGDG
jgi:xanthine dehydrogenase accessory factor